MSQPNNKLKIDTFGWLKEFMPKVGLITLLGKIKALSPETYEQSRNRLIVGG